MLVIAVFIYSETEPSNLFKMISQVGWMAKIKNYRTPKLLFFLCYNGFLEFSQGGELCLKHAHYIYFITEHEDGSIEMISLGIVFEGD